MFDTVWTCDHVILEMFPEKTRLFLGSGGAAVNPQGVQPPKEFKISSWCGTKCFPGVIGHMLRQPIYFRQKEFPPNVVFYRSSRGDPLPELGNNPFIIPIKEGENGRERLFEGFQFSIQLENSQQINYFTDRVLDCLKMKTLPIYWGCPNIGDFFDTSGWVFFDGSVEDLLKKIHNLTPDHYDKYTESINANYDKANKYGVGFYESFNYHALSQ